MPRSSAKSSKSKIEFSLQLFGDFQLQARDDSTTHPVRLPRRKVELLFAYLVLHPAENGHTREKLATLFWGDTPDEQARMSLRTSLAVLRKTLGDGALIADRERVQLNLDFKLRVDVREFLSHRWHSPETAVELYRGDLLVAAYDDWVLTERERLRSLYIETLLKLTQQYRSKSEYERAIAFARKILATDPANETAHQHVMFCEMARSNRAGALAQYDECVRALRDELAVEPSRDTQALANWIKQTPALSNSDAARISNVPIPLTSFIGRKNELTQIKTLLAGTRLLTLVGAGGSGKTRLSIQVSIELLDAPQFKDGVWWIELAHLTAPMQVAPTVAKALGVGAVPNRTMIQVITNYLCGKHLLLILDNCEHLLPACAELTNTLLREAPDLKIMTTSREPLNIPGESVWHVPTLAVPAESLTREQLVMSYEGVRLFVERANAVKPGFALTEENVHAVTQICRRLDGIPLAIELAAARVAVMSPQEIAARLNDRFNLLTSGSQVALPRQQTLRALVDWSFDLLSPNERTLFHRLAVFSGGRTLAMAEAVCAFGAIGKNQVLDLLARLVNKSLIFAEESNGETRYGFLDTIKQYAREKMEQSDEGDTVRDRHLNYFLDFAERAAPELTGPHQLDWLNRLEREHANLRSALWHATHKNRNTQALRLTAALAEFWSVRGYLAEGREWFKQALDASRADFESTTSQAFRAYYAWTLANAASLSAQYSDLATASANGEASLEIFRELGDKAGIATVLVTLGSLLRLQSDWASARARLEEAMTIAQELNDKHLIASALRNLGIISEFQDNYANARALIEQSLRLCREIGDQHEIANSLSNLGNIAQQQGDYAEARKLYQEILAIHRQAGAKWNVAATLTNTGNLVHSEGAYAAAQKFHEQALEIMRELGDKRGMAIVSTNLGNALLSQGDYEPALKLHTESLELRRALGDKRGIAITYGNLGDVHIGKGNFAKAQALYAEALIGLLGLGDKRTIVNCLIGAAQAAAGLGDYVCAAKLAGAIHVLRAIIDAEIDLRERAFHEHVTREAQEHLDPATFDAAWAEGEQLSMEQAIALVEQTQNR